MKIIRGNLEIELTDQELQDAYYEQRLKWDVQEVSCGWVALTLKESHERWKGLVEKVSKDPELLDRVAKKYREYLDDVITGEDELNCFIWSLESILWGTEVRK